MRFGNLVYPVSFDDAQDLQVIEDSLYEAKLVEELGLDAIWLTEHHFSGETAYASDFRQCVSGQDQSRDPGPRSRGNGVAQPGAARDPDRST